jgi:hypothetical protein
MDLQDESAWHSSIYSDWLYVLRTLSEPTTDSRFPEAMRTRAWALRRLNTQLASWTQLRHTAVLYAKQPYAPIFVCYYPAGFVEPNPLFWGALADMAEHTRKVIETLPMQGANLWQARRADIPARFTTLDLAVVKAGQLTFLTRFATNVRTLSLLAEKELSQQAFTTNETEFLLNLVELQAQYGVLRYTGWYPGMFYAAQEGKDTFSPSLPVPSGTYGQPEDVPDFRKSTALVTDVLTAPPDNLVGDPGAVLHEGVGNVHFMLVAVDSGPDRMVYGGPVFSHYEFNVPGVNRLNDTEWQKMLDDGSAPEAPEWTGSWLAPK